MAGLVPAAGYRGELLSNLVYERSGSDTPRLVNDRLSISELDVVDDQSQQREALDSFRPKKTNFKFISPRATRLRASYFWQRPQK